MENKDNQENKIIDANQSNEESGSSTGLEENIAALLCYLASFITGIIFLIIEKKSKFVRFHAMQSTVLFLAIWIIGFIIDYVPFIGGLLSMLVSLVGVILWIVLMIKAYQKDYFKVPVVGQIAEDFLNKQNTSA